MLLSMLFIIFPLLADFLVAFQFAEVWIFSGWFLVCVLVDSSVVRAELFPTGGFQFFNSSEGECIMRTPEIPEQLF